MTTVLNPLQWIHRWPMTWKGSASLRFSQSLQKICGIVGERVRYPRCRRVHGPLRLTLTVHPS